MACASPPSRFLERVLIGNFVVHALAMVSMLAFLVASLPGGITADDGVRIARIAAHPWMWRLGWFPWQVTAFADLLLGIAILRTPWIPKAPAIVALLFTIAAIIPDQAAQAMFVTRGVDLAQEAVRTSAPAPFLAFERVWFPRTAAWAACFYDASAIAWSVCFYRAGTWSRALTWLSLAAWSAFGVVSVGMLLPVAYRLPQALVSLGNALGFVLFEVWILAVLDRVLARSRPEQAHGRMARWRHPSSFLRWIVDPLSNSRALRALCERMPGLAFRSDITDVVYVNYLVDAERLVALVPEGLELQRLGGTGEDGALSIFTHLTYNHGHFGPRVLGPLRRLLGSPVQSNWRIHVRDPRTGVLGIYFVTTAISSTLSALAARLMTEGVPMHVPAHAQVRRDGDGTLHVSIDPGDGSAPDLEATLKPARAAVLPTPWSKCFSSYRQMLAFVVPQDRAMSTQPWRGIVTRHEIDLGIALDDCEPLDGEVASRAAEAIVGDARPLCFRVARVSFEFDAELRDPLASL